MTMSHKQVTKSDKYNQQTHEYSQIKQHSHSFKKFNTQWQFRELVQRSFGLRPNWELMPSSSLPTVFPRCRRGWAWAFQWSFFYSCQAGPKWDSRPLRLRPCAGGRGSLPGCVCSSYVTVEANQWQRNSGRRPHRSQHRHRANCLQGMREPFKRNTVNLVYQGNWRNGRGF